MPKVLHIIDAATPREMLSQLRLLAGAADEIVSIGPPPAGGVEWDAEAARRGTKTIHCPLGCPALAGKGLAPLARGAHAIHAWSISAASAALSVDGPAGGGIGHGRVATLSFSPEGKDLERIIGWAQSGDMFFTVPTRCAHAAMIRSGAPSESMAVLPPVAEPLVGAGEVRTKLRAALGIADNQAVLIAPGEMTRASGHKYGPWVHAVLRQIRGDLRLILPEGGKSDAHVRYYIETTGLGAETFLTDGRLALRDALAAADVAVFFHERDCGVGALAAAMAAGLPIVASRTPDVRECTDDGAAAELVAPGSPREGSVGVLKVIEDAALARRIGDAARRKAAEAFCVGECRRRLAEVYSLSTAAWQQAK